MRRFSRELSVGELFHRVFSRRLAKLNRSRTQKTVTSLDAVWEAWAVESMFSISQNVYSTKKRIREEEREKVRGDFARVLAHTSFASQVKAATDSNKICFIAL